MTAEPAVRVAPLLLLASHGSRDPVAQRAVLRLVEAATRELAAVRAETPVVGGFVDVQQPDVPQCLAEAEPGRDTVIVPLLISAGYHVRFDLANAVAAAAPRRVTVTAALGPDTRITEIVARRLTECGLADGDRLILAAAGSSDQNAVADCHAAGAQLSALLNRAVTVAFITAAQPRLPEAVQAARSEFPGARVVVASYLLAPGTFAAMAGRAGADIVSSALLVDGEEPPAALVEVLLDRYSNAAG
ncbi:sirohydrochlorin chelatase [Cryobacterium sp. PAMC25264]|uniref:sirohydrochlorin chelatase n=1 Tax=Cryobacterium sp. PAMC25264 TaxID=2861288 RepID=UPI001C62B242|nr:CbiX/SirB N-terminal domain-containing protein [Cryobacterium sp. PAMC25264]QYF75215.1 cobalamin biosynthesis protein CbiX [Cryobacterium sp. PAMC25264]